MCGVVCVVTPQPFAERQALCALLTDTLSHRGPDGGGLWSAPGLVTLGHRRLAIVDPTPGGAQPMLRGRYALCCNGEVYNHLTLAEECRRAGQTLRSGSDSEVLLATIERLGLHKALQGVQGPLGLVLWDGESRTLHLARDRFGKKQLYYYRHGEQLLVASVPKAIVVGARRLGWPLHVDRLVLGRYLADVEQEVGDTTFFAQIKRVPPAHIVSFVLSDTGVASGSPRQQTYYRLAPAPDVPRNRPDFLALFQERLSASLKLRLRCESPVGALLSGGLDSSALVCLARRLGYILPTFSAVFGPSHPQDESRYMQVVVAQTGVPQVRVHPGRQLSLDSFARFVEFQDEPTGGASVYAQMCVFAAVQERGIKVVLSGQGADEAFTGYGGAYGFALAERWHHRQWLRLATDLTKQSHSLQSLFQTVARAGWLSFRQGLPEELRHFALAIKWQRAFLQSRFFMLQHLGLPDISSGGPDADAVSERSLLSGYLYRLLTGSSLLTILRTEDRSSMAFGVETRTPFLDHALVELCLACPSDWLVRNGNTKAVLRDALADTLPAEIARRRDKIGFAAPQAEYLQKQLRPAVLEYLHKSQLASAGLADTVALQNAYLSEPTDLAVSHAIWKFLSIEAWLRSFSVAL